MTSNLEGLDKTISHLVELRRRVLLCAISLILTFFVLFFYADVIFNLLAKPLIVQMTGQQHMIATSVTSTFIAPIKFSFFIALFANIPFLLYHLWRFVSPGLYGGEKKNIWPLLIFSTLLFYLGVGFAYEVVLPLLFKFFIGFAPEQITLMPDISSYINLILKLFFAFGITFEVPIITVLLILSGITSAETLKKMRPYIIVGAFTVGMLLTPPDVLSQILLAIPLYCLFECGIIAAGFWVKESPAGPTQLSEGGSGEN